jgi:DNA polymerase
MEDLAGRPFVGPAGRLLDRALKDSGIDRERVYVTNIVKHFKWIVRGKKRLHQKPNVIEIQACRPWFEAEVARIAPAVIVCLGATAAQALFGRSFRVLTQRGHAITSLYGAVGVATVHPSSLLRIPDSADRARAYEDFVRDLRVVATHVAGSMRRRG